MLLTPVSRPLSLLLIALLGNVKHTDAFSSGGGEGIDSSGNPNLQTCDAIGICTGSTDGRCPPGMHEVAPPERSSVYQVRAGTGAKASDRTSYQPGELLPIYIHVTRRLIRGKMNAGSTWTANETAKYIGLLMYAVVTGDVSETKMGQWEIPLETPPRFWTPPDPGCAKKAVMHAGGRPSARLDRPH